jgi:hypothetical protein
MPAALRPAMSHSRQSGAPGVASTKPPERIKATTIGAMARCVVRRHGASLKRSQSSATHHAITAAGKQNARSATNAPGMPATFQPMRLAISTFGPGAACPTAKAWMNSAGVSQPLTSTTKRCISGMTEGMPPSDMSDSSPK